MTISKLHCCSNIVDKFTAAGKLQFMLLFLACGTGLHSQNSFCDLGLMVDVLSKSVFQGTDSET
jgi:hypothetical protein